MSEDSKLSLNSEPAAGAFVSFAIITGTKWKRYIFMGCINMLWPWIKCHKQQSSTSALETGRSRIKMPRNEGSCCDFMTSSMC